MVPFFPFDFVEVGEGLFLNLYAHKMLQRMYSPELGAACRQREGCAGFSRAPGTPNAVDIILIFVWNVIVENGIYVFHVNSACRNVGSHQNSGAPAFEITHDLVALILPQVTVNPGSLKTVFHQLPAKFVYRFFRVAENQSLLWVVVFEQEFQRTGLFISGNIAVILCNVVHCFASLIHSDHLRVGLELFRNLQNCGRHGGAEQNSLPVFRRLRQNGLNIFHEAHVQHFIRFVKDNCLQVFQRKSSAAQVVHNASRRADDDLRRAQLANLQRHGLAAAYDRHLDVLQVFGKFTNLRARLHGELARRAQNQNLSFFLAAVGDNLHDGDSERGGFSGAGVGTPDQVPPLQKHGNCADLDVGCFGIFHFFYGTQNFWNQVHFTKLHSFNPHFHRYIFYFIAYHEFVIE